ncbi:MAG: hypothetical protein ACP5GC_10615, partial [Thiomonas sp.]
MERSPPPRSLAELAAELSARMLRRDAAPCIDARSSAALEVATMAEKRQAQTPARLFVPGFDIGTFPNHLNRSSFIAPVARGPRKFHRQTVMVSRADCVLEYTGEQLDEADGDLLM